MACWQTGCISSIIDTRTICGFICGERMALKEMTVGGMELGISKVLLGIKFNYSGVCGGNGTADDQLT